MEEKITMPMLVSILSEKSGIGRNKCEDFIRDFISVAIEGLSAGESVRIKGIGVFKIVTVGARKSVDVNSGRDFEIPEHNKVVFVPAAEIAERVNAPFDMFDTVEIDDDFSDEVFDLLEDTVEDKAEDESLTSDDVIEIPESESNEDRVSLSCTVQSEKVTVSESKETSEDFIHGETTERSDVAEPEAPEAAEENVDELVAEETDVEEIQEIVSPAPANIEEEPEENIDEATGFDEADEIKESNLEEEGSRRKGKRGVWRFLAGIACGLVIGFAACILVGYILGYLPLEQVANEEKPTEMNIVAKEQKQVMPAVESNASDDSVVIDAGIKTEVDTQPSDVVVYDTISHTRYLTTMAKAHYGNYNLWPYIYEENSAFLGHPDRIRPGTRVVIPDLKKYGVKADNPEDIQKAKAKGVAIYARYNTKKSL